MDLNEIREWAEKWKIEFNVDKCKIIFLGKTNLKHTNTIGGLDRAITSEEKDLGVLIDNRLEFDDWFFLPRRKIFMNIYPVLVRLLLEYCVWSSYKKKYINLIEGV